MPRKMGRVNDAHEGTRMPTTGIFLFKAALPLRWLESVMCCPRIGEKIMPRERLAASPVFLANTGHDDRPISTRLAEVLGIYSRLAKRESLAWTLAKQLAEYQKCKV